MKYQLYPSPINLYVLIGNNINELLKEHGVEATGIDETTTACTVYTNIKIYCVFLKSELNDNIIVHESVHAAMRVLDFFGIKTHQSEELLAYYTDYIFDKIQEHVKQL